MISSFYDRFHCSHWSNIMSVCIFAEASLKFFFFLFNWMCTSPVRFCHAYLYFTPSFIFPSLFCSTDCDELSHLKCFLSACIPGGFHSPSIFSYCPPPSSFQWIPPLSVLSSFHPLPYCSCCLHPLRPVFWLFSRNHFCLHFFFFYPESIIWISVMLLHLSATFLCSK